MVVPSGSIVILPVIVIVIFIVMAVEYEHVCVAPTAGATDGCESDSWLNNMAKIAAIDTPK